MIKMSDDKIIATIFDDKIIVSDFAENNTKSIEEDNKIITQYFYSINGKISAILFNNFYQCLLAYIYVKLTNQTNCYMIELISRLFFKLITKHELNFEEIETLELLK